METSGGVLQHDADDPLHHLKKALKFDGLMETFLLVKRKKQGALTGLPRHPTIERFEVRRTQGARRCHVS